MSLLPEHSEESERIVLGSMIVSPDAAHVAIEKLQPDDFYKGAHRLIFAALTELCGRMAEVDAVLVNSELAKRGRDQEVGGLAYLTELMIDLATSGTIDTHVEIVKGLSMKRALVAAATECARIGGGNGQSAAELASDFSRRIAIVEERIAGGSARTDIRSILEDVFREAADDKHGALFSGLTFFDDKFGGFQPGELIVFCAPRGGGKSTLALQVLRKWAHDGIPGLVLSFEMSTKQLSACLLSSEGGFRLAKDWKVPDDLAWSRVKAAQAALNDLPIYLKECGSMRAGEAVALCRRYSRPPFNCRAFLVDYIQRVTPDSSRDENREQQVASISRALKGLALDLKAPVLTCSQLNDDGQARESRAIEHDADMLIYVDSPPAEECALTVNCGLVVRKNRSGETGAVPVVWERGWRRFENFHGDQKWTMTYIGRK